MILSFERNEILMEVKENTEKILPNSSKIGGKPWLPRDFQWPVFVDEEENIGRPLSFLCQIDLEDIKQYDNEGLLPDRGILYFFYECESMRWGSDAEDNGCAKVFYYEQTENFIAMEIPKEMAEENVVPEMAVCFKVNQSYPPFEEFFLRSDVECDFEAYDECLEKLSSDEEKEHHKLLGYAYNLQDEMLTDCARIRQELDNSQYILKKEESRQSDAKDWILLLQLSTLEKEEWKLTWGDCGMLYFYIRRQDLIEKRFENAWFVLQCM